ncbi:MAG TPA: class I SAM-dependent methyltransferase, partial [Ramlibacter sp.]|nr:class I SAM-dependent methyltransferase [Ramlibacter sp.]
MTASLTSSRAAARLRASPSFVLAFSQDGRPYVAKETEPYIQYWLTQRYRILLSLFSGRRGATSAEAVEAYFRLTGTAPVDTQRERLLKAVADMREAGVLIGARDDVSRYDARMAQDYLRHRPFPPALADFIIRQAPIQPDSRVLDLAGGPGSLALALARASNDVSLMDLSRGFVNAASARAAQLGLNLTAIHESCNRLMYRDDEYDVATVSQALHWLDDVLVCRGICRVLRPGGSFFVIHASMDLDDSHPLAPVLGNDSILGGKDRQPFANQVHSLVRRLALLFEALDAPDVQRHDPTQRWGAPGDAPPPRIVPAGVSLFRQRRPFDLGYARAFLTPNHIRSTGQAPSAFWKILESRCAKALPQAFMGHFDWAVLHFRRGGPA